MKLLMCFPGTKDVQTEEDFKDLEKQADCPLVANLPKMEFLDVKSRVRGAKKRAEFLCLIRIEQTVASTYSVDVKNEQINKVGGQSSKVQHAILIVRFDKNQKEPKVKNEIPIPYEPVPCATTSEGNREVQTQYGIYFLQSGKSDLVFFVKSNDGESLTALELNRDSERFIKKPIDVDCPLYTHLVKPLDHELDEEGNPTARSEIRKGKFCEPSLLDAGESGRIVAYTSISADWEFSVRLHSLDLNKEIGVLEGAQALLTRMPNQEEEEGSQTLLFLADPTLNKVVAEFQTDLFKNKQKLKKDYPQAKSCQVDLTGA